MLTDHAVADLRGLAIFRDYSFMPMKTLKQLRALARTRGLRGYSKMSRPELERLLAAPSVRAEKPVKAKKTAAKPATTAAKKKSTPPSVKSETVRATPARSTPPEISRTTPGAMPKWEWSADQAGASREEERVEDAKYVTTSPGQAMTRAAVADLDEDIEHLPALEEEALCLMPQKPGVLHGYWTLPAAALAKTRAMKLRLGRIQRETFEIFDEITLPQAHGRWYFQIDESSDLATVYLQMGYYEPDGRFVIATRRGIARIPSLYASERTDRLWWVSEELFRAMYRRAGGNVRGPRLGWTASIGSSGGPPAAPSSERLAWPGNRSS